MESIFFIGKLRKLEASVEAASATCTSDTWQAEAKRGIIHGTPPSEVSPAFPVSSLLAGGLCVFNRVADAAH